MQTDIAARKFFKDTLTRSKNFRSLSYWYNQYHTGLSQSYLSELQIPSGKMAEFRKRSIFKVNYTKTKEEVCKHLLKM